MTFSRHNISGLLHETMNLRAAVAQLFGIEGNALLSEFSTAIDSQNGAIKIVIHNYLLFLLSTNDGTAIKAGKFLQI